VAILILVAAAVFASTVTFAQTAAPAFEVASIKASSAAPGSASGIRSDTGRIAGRNVTLRGCVQSAYGIPEALIFGGPKWVDEERYDIDAKAPGPAGDREMMIMLQSLLAERFKLVIHHETRPIQGYALVAGKKGLTAKRSEPGTPSVTSSSRRSIDAVSCSMERLAAKLAGVLHAPVEDLTGIEGNFDFKLEWTPDELQSGVFAALEEQLGLKLEGRKVPTETIVIDSAAKPSEN
jgi:uncharacterized protein (TIGR03435 family)